MFSKILIANRGEIALRIMRTCKKMGIKTVAVYSDVDSESLHVQQSDESYSIGGDVPTGSYLKIKSIIEAAESTGADAIHPGYGFLSENAEFVKACEKADITFIGPAPEVMKRMSNKVRARKLAKKAGLPVLPGSEGEVKDNVALEHANYNGFPLLVKAANGGGGIGIHVVNSPKELKGVMSKARSLARKAFGSKRVYFERFLQGASHLEVQIVADTHGNVVHLFERDCSVQRRNQKVIEEAPSTKLTDGQRERLLEYAVTLAKYINYTNVGTVEFLVTREGDIYFLEMNTRLQVEHGITELITGVDMVELQINIAAGELLSFKQEDIKINGHAIEARINAENPDTFLPTTGVVSVLDTPQGDHVRLDSAIFVGHEVSTYYDPLLAKLMVWGEDRQQAIGRLDQAVGELRIEGVQTLIPAIRKVLNHKLFVSANYDTSILQKLQSGTVDDIEIALPDVYLNGNNGSRKSEIAKIAVDMLLSMDKGSAKGHQNGANMTAWKIAGRQSQMTNLLRFRGRG